MIATSLRGASTLKSLTALSRSDSEMSFHVASCYFENAAGVKIALGIEKHQRFPGAAVTRRRETLRNSARLVRGQQRRRVGANGRREGLAGFRARPRWERSSEVISSRVR